MSEREPARWIHSPDVDDDLKAVLGELGRGPSSAALGRLSERLVERLPEGVGQHGCVAEARAGAPSTLRHLRPWLFSGLGAALLFAGFMALGDRPASTPARVPEQAMRPAVAPVVEPSPARAALRPAPDEVHSPLRADSSLEASSGPHAPHVRRAQRAKHASADARTLEERANPLSELAILRRARDVLRRAPEQALELTDQHRRAYLRGLLAEERELLAIEALMNLGRAGEAQSRADAFRRAFPGSAHARRLGVIVNQPAR